jgi:hypothetical protein
MGPDAHSSAQFICAANDSVEIRFPRKKGYLSVSTARGIRKRDREAKKFGSLKYFEVCDVQGKESWFDKKLL